MSSADISEIGLPSSDTADDGSGHYFGETTRIAGEGKKVILNGMKDDHKSKVAEQFSKSLGLRSG